MDKRCIKFRSLELGTNSTGTADTSYILYELNLNDGSVSRQEDKPIGRNGIIVSNASYDARVINIKGTICASSMDDLFQKMQALNTACDGITPDTLFFYSRNKTYKSNNVIADVPQYGAVEGTTIDFNINFTLTEYTWLDNTAIAITASVGSAMYLMYLNNVYIDTTPNSFIIQIPANTITKAENCYIRLYTSAQDLTYRQPYHRIDFMIPATAANKAFAYTINPTAGTISTNTSGTAPVNVVGDWEEMKIHRNYTAIELVIENNLGNTRIAFRCIYNPPVGAVM